MIAIDREGDVKLGNHNYINPKIVKAFKKGLDIEDIYIDLRDTYHIKNIREDDDIDEFRAFLAEVLASDCKFQRSYYKSYIEAGMDARLLMELRNSSLLAAVGDEFLAGHKKCETQAEVREYRADYLRRYNRDYLDLDWQLYFVARGLTGKSHGCEYIDVCFEDCFADGDLSKQTYYEDYMEQLKDSKFMLREDFVLKYNLGDKLDALGVEWRM